MAMSGKLRIIGQVIREQGDILVGSPNKVAVQFLKFTKWSPFLKFSSIDLATAFFSNRSIEENIMIQALGRDFDKSKELNPVEVVKKEGDELLVELMGLLPPCSRRPSFYRRDELWCYALIQEILKKNEVLFIHDDSSIQNSKYLELVNKIFKESKRLKEMSIIFTQDKPPVLSKVISHRVFLSYEAVKIEKREQAPKNKLRLVA